MNFYGLDTGPALLIPLMAGFLLKHPGKRSGIYSIWTGFITAAFLFISFETMGNYDPSLETQVLSFPEYGLQFYRGHLLIVTLPLSAMAFVIGTIQDRMEESA